MTVIVGITHKRRVWIGADAAYTAGGFRVPCDMPKVWNQGAFVFGLTGSPREQQLIRHRVDVPTKVPADLMNWLCVDFVDAVRAARQAGGYSTKLSGGEEQSPDLVIGVREQLFLMDSDYQVDVYPDFAVAGSGREVAYGSLHTTSKWASPSKRITAALDAACAGNVYCQGPYTIVKT